MPKFESLAWNGVLVPAGAPADIVNRSNREIDVVLKLPDVKMRLHNAGLEPAGDSPEKFGSLMIAEAKNGLKSSGKPEQSATKSISLSGCVAENLIALL